MSENDDDRSQGIDFGNLDGALGDLDYPASRDDIIEESGDARIGLANDAVTLEEVLPPADAVESYDSPGAVRRTVKNFVGGEAVGVRNYSDRGTGHVGENTPGSGDEA